MAQQGTRGTKTGGDHKTFWLYSGHTGLESHLQAPSPQAPANIETPNGYKNLHIQRRKQAAPRSRGNRCARGGKDLFSVAHPQTRQVASATPNPTGGLSVLIFERLKALCSQGFLHLLPGCDSPPGRGFQTLTLLASLEVPAITGSDMKIHCFYCDRASLPEECTPDSHWTCQRRGLETSPYLSCPRLQSMTPTFPDIPLLALSFTVLGIHCLYSQCYLRASHPHLSPACRSSF